MKKALAVIAGAAALAGAAEAAPLYTFASFSTIGTGLSLVNVSVASLFRNDPVMGGRTLYNPCGFGVASCLFLMSGSQFGGTNALNLTINLSSTWSSITDKLGVGPDGRWGTADDTPAKVSSVFTYDPTQISKDFKAPILQSTIVGAEFTMSLRSLTPIGGCTPADPSCLQHFDAGVVDFRLNPWELATLNAQDPATIGTSGSLLHLDITQLHAPNTGTYGGLLGRRNATSNIGFQGDDDHSAAPSSTSDVFAFSSDYLDFGSQDLSSFAWSANVVNPCISRTTSNVFTLSGGVPGLCTGSNSASGSYVHSATLNGVTGSFGASPKPASIYTSVVVPELSPFTLSLSGGLLIALMRMMRKRIASERD